MDEEMLYCDESLSDDNISYDSFYKPFCVFKKDDYCLIHECTNKYDDNLRTIPNTPVWSYVNIILGNEPEYNQLMCMRCYKQLSEKENAMFKKKFNSENENEPSIKKEQEVKKAKQRSLKKKRGGQTQLQKNLQRLDRQDPPILEDSLSHTE